MERGLFRFFILLIFFWGGGGRDGCLRCFQKTDTNGILFLHAVLIYIHKQWNSAQYVEAEQNKYYERKKRTQLHVVTSFFSSHNIYIYIYFFFFSACTSHYCVKGNCKMVDGNPTCE